MTLEVSAPLATAIAVKMLQMLPDKNLSTMLTVFSPNVSVVLPTLLAALAYVNNNLEKLKRTWTFFNSSRRNAKCFPPIGESACRHTNDQLGSVISDKGAYRHAEDTSFLLCQ